MSTVSGFQFSGIDCGLKEQGLDLALIHSLYPAKAAGVFTTNAFQSPAVCLSREIVRKRLPVRSIIANSGNANACTGKAGMKAALRMQSALAEQLKIEPHEILSASTGVIGRPLPVELIENSAGRLVEELSEDPLAAAAAILTTDTRPKFFFTEIEINQKTVRIGGIAKGAGMIYPNLATMLAFLFTDADLPYPLLEELLKKSVDLSFNRISVDGDSSTNDTVLLLANGASGISLHRDSDIKLFSGGLNQVCLTLAKDLIKDAEGATKFIEIKVHGARTEAAAEKIAKRVANSLLVKTAIFGKDPNWGRIVMAVGNAGVEINPDSVSVVIQDEILFADGEAVMGVDLNHLSKRLEAGEIDILIDLHQGSARYTAYTCDLSYEYVRINAEYTT